jgi:protein FrlC
MKNLKMSQIAVGNYTYPLFPFDYFLDRMVEFEISTIELWAASPHLYLEDYTLSMLSKMARKISARDLSVVCLTPEQCAYPINLGASEPYIRKRSLRYFEKAIEAANIMGIPNVLVTPGNGYRNQSNESAFKYTVENIRILAEYAAAKHVHLFLEHLTVETSNVAVKAHELQQLWSSINSPNVSCMLDTDMMSRYDETVGDFLTATQNQIKHVHLVDGMPGGHLALGDGNLPLSDFLETLDQSNYQGYLTLEIMNERYLLDPDQAIIKSLNWLKQIIK